MWKGKKTLARTHDFFNSSGGCSNRNSFLPHHIELSVHKFDAQIDIYSIETHNFLVSCPSAIPRSLCVFVSAFFPSSLSISVLFICILMSVEAYLLPRLFYAHTHPHYARVSPFLILCWEFLVGIDCAEPMKDGKMFTIWITFCWDLCKYSFGREKKANKETRAERKYVWREKICGKRKTSRCFLWIKGIPNILPANILLYEYTIHIGKSKTYWLH